MPILCSCSRHIPRYIESDWYHIGREELLYPLTNGTTHKKLAIAWYDYIKPIIATKIYSLSTLVALKFTFRQHMQTCTGI